MEMLDVLLTSKTTLTTFESIAFFGTVTLTIMADWISRNDPPIDF